MRTILQLALAHIPSTMLSMFKDPIALSIILNDLLLWGTGILIGGIVTFIAVPLLFKGVYISPHFEGNEEVEMVSIINKKSGDEYCYINPRTKMQAFSVMLTYLFWRFIPNKKKKTYYLLTSSKVNKFFYYLLIGILLLCSFIGLLSIFTIIAYVR